MKKDKSGQEKTKKQIEEEYEKLNDIFGYLFSKELWDSAKLNIELFDDVFVNRKSVIREFERRGRPMLGGGILFLGRMGAGKSTLILKLKNLIHRHELFEDEPREIRSLLLDLENEDPNDTAGLIKKGTRLFLEYIDEVAPNRFRELNELEDMPAMKGVHLVARTLTELLRERGERLPYVFLFIDDLDYALGAWYDLVMQLSSITALPFVSAVYAARPPLVSTMFSHSDFRIQRTLRDARQIWVPTLPVRELVTRRVMEVTRETKKQRWRRVLTRWGIRPNRLFGLLESVGLRRDGEFKYPFTKKLEEFVEKSTNGDARQMLSMVTSCLQYIVKNRASFKPDDKGFYHFLRPIIMEEFGVYKRFPIVNLNSEKFLSYRKGVGKKSGFPLLYNILEWISYCEGNDGKVKDAFERLGHDRDDVDRGVQACLEFGLIEPLLEGVERESHEWSIHNYIVSPKGRFHLTHIITWGEYTDEFENFKGGIDRTFYRRLPMNAMYTDVIEFLLYLVTAIRDVDAEAAELTISLTRIIDWYVEYQTTYLRPAIQELYSPENPNSDYMIDEDKLDYLLYNPPIDLGLGRDVIVRGKYVAHKKKKPTEYVEKISIDHILRAANRIGIGKESKLETKDRCDFEYFVSLVEQVQYE
jgi:hypothetical protein